jgi:hypothetical protein
MTTRNRIKSSEKQAALIWQQVVGKELASTEDELVTVIYPGRTNDVGPDFRDAVIVSKSRLTKGDVEVHLKSSDWYSHKHHTNAEYNNVVLHVVMWHDCNSVTLLQSGKAVPVLCLAKALRHQSYLLPYQLPCSQILHHVDRQTLEKLLNDTGKERFKQKARHFETKLNQEDPGQALFRGMMRALGYTQNTKPFEELADRIPLSPIESTEGLALKQALLLGTAGLLPSQRRLGEFAREKEVQELEQMWQSVGKRIKPMKENAWSFSHIYPNNSPVRRIVAQSYLLERYCAGKLLAGILQMVKEAPLPGGHRALENGLTVAGDGYWQDHFDFDVRSGAKISSLLGNNKAGEIAVNVILPFAFSWGRMFGEPELMKTAMGLYNSYPKLAENEITRHMVNQFCLKEPFDFTASHQQGLIHIFHNYCREGRCGQCPIVG